MGRGNRFVDRPIERRGGDDASLQQAVNEALALDPRTTNAIIHVDVRNGVVTLHGTVTYESTRRAAEDVAATIPGVGHVHNELALRGPVMGP